MQLLSGLGHQRSDGLFSYSVVVVDNDCYKSAQSVVQSIQQMSSFEVKYCVESIKNIALARNRAVENAKGDFIAFIDDDEFPANDWLLNLYAARSRFEADGVLGPVKPYYEEKCPKWIVKGRLCERESHPTGTIMSATDSRTGNALLKRDIFDDADNRFDSEFGERAAKMSGSL